MPTYEFKCFRGHIWTRKMHYTEFYSYSACPASYNHLTGGSTCRAIGRIVIKPFSLRMK